MSAALAVASSLVTSAAYVGPPAAAIVVAQTADNLPPVASAGLAGLGGLAFLVTFLKQGGLTGLIRLFKGSDDPKPAPRPDHPLPPVHTHAHQLVTHGELEARLARIEAKIDHNAETASEAIKDLTNSMTNVLRDMTKAIGRLEGKIEAQPAKR